MHPALPPHKNRFLIPTMQPTINDVLSGRGPCFNRHPGNKQFRRMLHEQKDAYMTGTKKQKMDISKAIVEAIHSMDPPGRFLKKCPTTGQWKELSKRDAADKAAQAMAWAIKGDVLKLKRRDRHLRKAPSLPSQDHDEDDDEDTGAKSSTSADHRAANNHGLSSLSFPVSRRDGLVGNLQQPNSNTVVSSSTTTSLPATSSGNSENVNQHVRAQLILHTLQQQQLQQQLLPTLGQIPFEAQTLQVGLPPPPQVLPQIDQIQQQLLLRHLLNHQTRELAASAALPSSISLSTLIALIGNRPQSAHNNLLQNLVQQQASTPTPGSVLSNLQFHTHNMLPGISNYNTSNLQGVSEVDPLHLRLLMMQQNQLLTSPLGVSSNNNHLLFQQQQQLHQLQAAAQQLQQNRSTASQLLPPSNQRQPVVSKNEEEEEKQESDKR